VQNPVSLCTFSLNPVSDQNVPADGQRRAVRLSAVSGTNCAWTASSSATWAQVYPLAGVLSAPASTEVEYNVFSNFGTTKREARLVIGGLPLSVAQNGNPSSSNERFVRLLYDKFLGRAADPAGLAVQLASLEKGTPRAAMAENFYNSDEFNQGRRFIKGLYIGLLDRGSEYDGWLFQSGALARGVVNQLSLVSNFLTGLESELKFGKLQYGAPHTRAFILRLYRYILLRVPSEEELNAQISAARLAGKFETTEKHANRLLRRASRA
jgi:hypothetical protein